MKQIPTLQQANAFRRAVKEHSIPSKTQLKIAKSIKEDGNHPTPRQPEGGLVGELGWEF